jgi:hypothetical protein
MDVMKRPVLELSANGMDSTELFAQWREYAACRDEVAATIMTMADRWHKETDPVVRDRLGVELDEVRPHFEVLCAWTDVFHTAWVFSTQGCESKFIPSDTVAIMSEIPV